MLLRVESEASPAGKDLSEAVWTAVTKLYGEVGASQAGLSLVDYDEERKTGVLRVSLGSLQQVRASIATITFLSGKDAAVNVSTMSGTLRTIRKKIES